MDKKLAFTLIELLVVIAIVGILSGLIMVSTNSMTQKANLAKAQMFSSSLRNSLMANITGEWKFDEASGTAANETWTRTNNGTLTNFTDTTAGYGDSSSNADGWMSSSNCISGTCLKFDGIDDYINCGTGSSLNITGAITISAWVKKYDLTSRDDIVTKLAAGFNFLTHSTANYNRLYLQAQDTGGTWRSVYSNNYAIADSNWHFIAVTYSRPTAVFYVDGQNWGTGSRDYDVMSGSGDFIIGAIVESGNSSNISGVLDEVRVYNTVIPTSQIKEQYYAGLNKLLYSKQIEKRGYLEKMAKLDESLHISEN
jgi:prepilin-type N-terminal cleavage/methylation domain-containing protein